MHCFLPQLVWLFGMNLSSTSPHRVVHHSVFTGRYMDGSLRKFRPTTKAVLFKAISAEYVMVITLHLGRQLNSSNISKVTWQKDNWFSSSFSESIRNSDWDWRSWLQTCLLLSEQVLSLALVKTPLILTMDGQPKHQLTSCHISSSASSGHQRFAKDRQGFGPASGWYPRCDLGPSVLLPLFDTRCSWVLHSFFHPLVSRRGQSGRCHLVPSGFIVRTSTHCST